MVIENRQLSFSFVVVCRGGADAEQISCSRMDKQCRVGALGSFILLSLIVSGAYGMNDEEWEAGLGSDMCPEKADIIPLDASFPSSSNDDNNYNNEIVQMKQLLSQQSAQIEKLSELITKLDRSLTALPSINPAPPAIKQKPAAAIPEKQPDIQKAAAIPKPEKLPIETTEAMEDVVSKPVPQFVKAGPGGGMTVARYKPAWAEHFQFVSAVKVDVDVSCLHVLPHEGDDGMSRYVAVGDAAGRIYIFFTHGDLLVDYATLSQAPVTAMLSFSMRKNETWLVTGHADGAVLVHRLWEIVHRGSPSTDEAHQLVLEFVHSLVAPPPPSSESGGSFDLAPLFDHTVEEQQGPPSKLITHLEMYRVGKMRYVLVADCNGKMQVFRENGTLFGVADSLSRPLAFLRTPNTQRLLFLTKTGGGSLDLRTMTVRSCPCDGLNRSTVVAYAFDAAGRSRAYGFTEEGDLLYVILSGDTLHFECHARPAKRKLEVEGPVSLHGIKGYLVVATPRHVFVYNTTLQVGFSYANIRGGAGPRPLFSASLDDISLSFLPTPIVPGKWPMMACNRDKLIVVGFGAGYVGIYRSTLPVHKLPDFNAKLWSSPIFISVILLLVAWQLLSRKRDPVPTDSNNPVMQLAPSTVGGASGGFGYRDNREGSLGKAARSRYESPSRNYSSKPVAAYGQSSMNYRASASDPNYSSRREPLFANQTVGDLLH